MSKSGKKILRPEVRRVVSMNGAFYLCVPKKIVDRYSIKVGDPYTIIAKEGTLTSVPMQGEEPDVAPV